ncbi:MAG: hypothetical protein KKE30_04990 [Gammaproteobacteria bacterium]|nr:hypothetical protein [Gammaproteobacteria bacterium]
MKSEPITEKQLEQLLWAVKESAWELYANAFWKPRIPALVEAVTRQVNATLRSLGYDPIVIVR